MSGTEFIVVAGDDPSQCVVTARGEIDIYTGEDLRVVLRDALARRPRQLILDLAEVSFIDSSGLGVIITAYKRAEEGGTALAVRSPSDRVRRVLELTGVSRVLPVISD